MLTELVITAAGPDRSGLVETLTGVLNECGGNLADSRMVNLRGRFALVLLAEVAEDRVDALTSGMIAAGQRVGLTVTVTTPAGVTTPRERGIAFSLNVQAMDQPGIVHRVTHLLHRHQANIEELDTRLEPGAYTGTPLFSMRLVMTVPASSSIKRLRAELQELCDGLNCDAELKPVKPV